MKSINEVLARIDSIQARIDMLEDKYQAQLALHRLQRDKTLMKFLLEEQATYRLAQSQLDWVIQDPLKTSNHP